VTLQYGRSAVGNRTNKASRVSRLRPRPHYAGEIWKRSFISTVWPTVHTNPSRKRSFLRTELFENGAFRKHSSNQGNLKTPAFRFRVNRKHFQNEAFRKRCTHVNHAISLNEFSSNTNPRWPVIIAFLPSSSVVWTENIWCVFNVKPPFSNSSGVVWTGLAVSTSFSFSQSQMSCRMG